jgi:hypothetical protein
MKQNPLKKRHVCAIIKPQGHSKPYRHGKGGREHDGERKTGYKNGYSL